MLILASQSPRRRELLERAGFQFHVAAPGIEERRAGDEPAEAYVERLARDKAAAVAAGPEDFVLAADTVVAVDHHVLEKPEDAADARRMLKLLSGRVHDVYTGIALRHGADLRSAVERTAVHCSTLSEAEIETYVASGEPMDKAGSYAIQGLASKFIYRVEGCYFNVVGLPVSAVYRMLVEAGFPMPA